MQVVIFARHIPRHVRLVKPGHEEERAIMFFSELGNGVVGDRGVGNRLVATAHDSKSDAADAAVLERRPDRAGASPGGRPLLWKTEAAMPEFAHAERFVSGIF